MDFLHLELRSQPLLFVQLMLEHHVELRFIEDVGGGGRGILLMGLLSETGDGCSGMHPAAGLMLVLDVACSCDLHYLNCGNTRKQSHSLPRLSLPPTVSLSRHL